MKKISNPGLIDRNKKIGNYAQIAGMVVLVGGFALTLYQQNSLMLSYGSLLLGIVLVNIGAGFTNKWGRIPPPDQVIDDLLKGLDDRYTIVHFRLDAEHALFTPNGIVTIMPKYERGTIAFDGKKWKQGGVSRLSKFFGVEAIGNPTLDAEMQGRMLSERLRKILKVDEIPPVRPLVVFVNEKTQLDVNLAPIPVLHATKFKDYIRHLPKNPTVTPEQLQQVLESAGEKS